MPSTPPRRNRARIQDLLTEAARTWARPAARVGDAPVPSQAAVAEHYADALPEEYKQVVNPFEAIADIGIIEGLQPDSVRLQFEPGDEETAGSLTSPGIWAARSASLSHCFRCCSAWGSRCSRSGRSPVTRRDGLTVWIYQFTIRPEASVPQSAVGDDWDATAARFTEAVTAIWDGRVEIDRFNELVLRAGLTWQQVMVLRAYAKYLRQAGFPYSQSHIESVLQRQRLHRPLAGGAVRGDLRPGLGGARASTPRPPPRR